MSFSQRYRLGFLGCGNMAQAIIRGVIGKGLLEPKQIIASDVSQEIRQNAAASFGIGITADNQEAAQRSDILILAVKPNQCRQVLFEIRDVMSEGNTLVSIVAGWTTAQLLKHMEIGACVLRVMPNTPMMVGEGMTAISLQHNIPEDTLQLIQEIFASLGRVEMVDERDMDAITALSASGPAYAFLMMEAMIDSGVRLGLKRGLAAELAAQTLLGSAKMVLQSDEHPVKLRNAVTSPGGTTAAALYELEKGGFRMAIDCAIEAAAKKSKELSSNNE